MYVRVGAIIIELIDTFFCNKLMIILSRIRYVGREPYRDKNVSRNYLANK